MNTIYDSLFITHGSSRVGVNPQGGYVTSWDDILYSGSKIQRTGIPVLFPHFGKSEKYRMHGFGRDSLWAIAKHTDNSIAMELTSEMIDSESKKEYPYAFSAKISVTLESEDKLLYSLYISNYSKESLPILPGLHPYWTIDHTKKKELQVEGIHGFDAKSMDWDNSPPDNLYSFTGEAAIHFPNKKILIKDLSGAIKNIVIWSQTPVRDPDFNFVCVEPVCGDHYGIDHSPISVESGKTWEMKLLFEVSR